MHLRYRIYTANTSCIIIWKLLLIWYVPDTKSYLNHTKIRSLIFHCVKVNTWLSLGWELQLYNRTQHGMQYNNWCCIAVTRHRPCIKVLILWLAECLQQKSILSSIYGSAEAFDDCRLLHNHQRLIFANILQLTIVMGARPHHWYRNAQVANS